MRAARATLIDQTDLTCLALCPLCNFRDVGTDEAEQRMRLLAHLFDSHESEAKTQRDTLKRWLWRRGIAA